MTMPSNMRQHAQELITQLPSSSLPQVVAILEELCRSVDSTPQTFPEYQQERILLHKIHQKLAPEEQARLAYLRQRNASEIITEPEYQKLLHTLIASNCKMPNAQKP